MPHSNVDPAKRLLARHLRSNVTDAEKKTWFMIRDRRILGAKFRRQQPIGPYVVDFFCPEFGLVIEIDGSQHAERQAAYDRGRTQWLESKGYKVIRFWNNDVLLEPRSVAEAIYHALLDRGAREPPQSGPSGRTAPPRGGSEGRGG
ncbi:MAG: endonuclease domain-containing protein [Candidatus Odyssella sp.]|nr:endonuclease domain-containing protein [Candidatus Odyssella sp.]